MGFFIDAGVVATFAALLVAAAWGDIRNYRIPNALVGAFLVLFVLAFAFGLIPRHEIVGHLGAGVVVLLLGMALFRFNWIGGGDAKLIAALALWAFFARRPRIYGPAASLVAAILWRRGRRLGRLASLPLAGGWTRSRDLPAPAGSTFQDMWRRRS